MFPRPCSCTALALGAATLVSSAACGAYNGIFVSGVSTTVALNPENPDKLTPVTVYRVWAYFTDPADALLAWGTGGPLGPGYFYNWTGWWPLTGVIPPGQGFLDNAAGGVLPPLSSTTLAMSDSFFTIGVSLQNQIPLDQGVSLVSGPGNPAYLSGNMIVFPDGAGVTTPATTLSGAPNPITLAGFTGDGDTALRVLMMQVMVPAGEFMYGRVGVTVRVGGVTATIQSQLVASFLTPPPPGTCCLPNSCQHIPAYVCKTQGGQFHATLTNCSAVCTFGDINGDSRVDVDDLLAVIVAWGPCLYCQFYFCAADVNADCAVNADDLLIVIANWSP